VNNLKPSIVLSNTRETAVESWVKSNGQKGDARFLSHQRPSKNLRQRSPLKHVTFAEE
jgi:hypothetical protein